MKIIIWKIYELYIDRFVIENEDWKKKRQKKTNPDDQPTKILSNRWWLIIFFKQDEGNTTAFLPRLPLSSSRAPSAWHVPRRCEPRSLPGTPAWTDGTNFFLPLIQSQNLRTLSKLHTAEPPSWTMTIDLILVTNIYKRWIIYISILINPDINTSLNSKDIAWFDINLNFEILKVGVKDRIG